MSYLNEASSGLKGPYLYLDHGVCLDQVSVFYQKTTIIIIIIIRLKRGQPLQRTWGGGFLSTVLTSIRGTGVDFWKTNPLLLLAPILVGVAMEGVEL